MRATGSGVFFISSREIDPDSKGVIYYDSDRNLYAVFIDDNFVSEHNNMLDAVKSLDDVVREIAENGN